MNNGNVTQAAVGVAKRLSERLESILKRFVLGVKHEPLWRTWGQGSFRGKTLPGQAGGQVGQAGRQGQTKSPRQ